MLSVNLKGAFLGSEYPHKQYREVIEDVFDIDTISWYGHTERAVLAYEKHEQFVYEPFLSYGFSEAIKNEEGEYESLVVEIGDAKGDNFWCVLLPPLCLLEGEEENKESIKYTSFIKEIIDKYF